MIMMIMILKRSKKAKDNFEINLRNNFSIDKDNLVDIKFFYYDREQDQLNLICNYIFEEFKINGSTLSYFANCNLILKLIQNLKEEDLDRNFSNEMKKDEKRNCIKF